MIIAIAIYAVIIFISLVIVLVVDPDAGDRK